jgi:outer membrane protein OmpA-like peptidoglycan-associated protein
MIKFFAIPAITIGLLSAQVTPNPTQTQAGTSSNQVVTLDRQPIYKITVVSRTAKAINYRHRSGATKINFQGTALLPKSRGEAKVESKQGYIEIEVEFDNLTPATQFGPEYLTYVMWAISPEGRASNLGEVLLNGTKSKLNVSTELQAFGLIMTAEPYFGVTQPSDVVVMENIIRKDTLGKVEEIDAKYELLQRGQYVFNVDKSRIKPLNVSDTNTPLDLYEARNAVQIARWTGADKYASDSYQKAAGLLTQAEDYHARKQKKPTSMVAREAVQTAEDSRLIAIRRIEQERLDMERQASADREAKSKAEADASDRQQKAEAARRAEAELAARVSAERAAQSDAERAAAERAKAEAMAAQQVAAKDRADADAARAAAVAQQQLAMAETEKARLAAAEADRMRMKAEGDREALRKQLLDQFNLILETRDTARGLIVNMSDVLFDTAKYTLRPAAREKLARISGIVLSHPGLKLEVEGHTDSVGSEAYNQTLSEKRASSVRDYLTGSGISPTVVTAKGFGKTMPVASNDNAAGRQQNRRVELVVSGEVIGTKLSEIHTSTVPANR